jgi:hypothetical protein
MILDARAPAPNNAALFVKNERREAALSLKKDRREEFVVFDWLFMIIFHSSML